MSIKFTETKFVKGAEEPLDKICKDIKCANCDILLIKSVQLKDIPISETVEINKNLLRINKKYYKYIFKCPFCDGKSFIETFNYKAFFEPINCKIVNIETIEKNGEEICLVQLK